MLRRDFLGLGIGVGAGALPLRLAAAEPIARPAVYFVPGYRPERAHFRGRPLLAAPEFRRFIPKGHDGGTTLVTRIDEADGSIRRALLPIVGHAIAVAPDGRVAVWSSNNGPALLTFDPASLELGRLADYQPGEYLGGGHGVFTPDGRAIVLSERRLATGFGDPRDHYGRITVRDPETLAVLDAFSCAGMSPHEIELMADGRHLAVANYGSYAMPGDWRPRIVEPSLTILELASGKLVDKRVSADLGAETTHLAAYSFERVSTVRLRRGDREEERALLADRAEVYEPDASPFDEGAYLPGPVQRYEGAQPGEGPAALPADPLRARHGQSVVYDPAADEMLATFTSSHAVMVTDGADGRVKRLIETERHGLRYPRGIALHPDGAHYAVSGSWQDILLFRRGTHEPAPERALRATFFDHSHMTVA